MTTERQLLPSQRRWSRRATIWLSLFGGLVWLLAGCIELGTVEPSAIELGHVDYQADGSAQINMQLHLGQAYYSALNSSVPLTLKWELQLLQRGRLWSSPVWQRQGQRVVGYRSLRDQYTIEDRDSQQLADNNGPVQRFNTKQALELGLAQLTINQLAPPNTDQTLRFRLQLDAEALPPPMRLPARINPIWWLDSNWQSLAASAG